MLNSIIKQKVMLNRTWIHIDQILSYKYIHAFYISNCLLIGILNNEIVVA